MVAGASGYIGRSLIPKLLEKFPEATITALSRSAQPGEDPRVQWRACDLFSLESLEATVPEDIDLAVYLVHSMGPTAQLDQGSFSDYDLILADNFARCLSRRPPKQLIYLGGLIPKSPDLSKHLRSRLEVEEVFKEYKLPTTVFRAGLILGDEGSSFQILLKLVNRLPFMICPAWTKTETTPVDLESVLHTLSASALDERHLNKVYDLAGCRPLTYLDMMRETAAKLGRKRAFISVPFFTPTLSRLWVSLITNSPKGLVYPLIESLAHPMVARESHMFNQVSSRRSYSQLLDLATLKTKRSGSSFFRFRAQGNTVRSVQRLNLPTGKDAVWVKQRYLTWLPRFLAPLILVDVEGSRITFALLTKKLKMLELYRDEERSDRDRQLLYIVDGRLVAQKQGCLEFRVVLNRRFVLASIHEFRPALPWYLYVLTQAKLHLWVMSAFGRDLKS